jgi:GT2 family glycosyltransferase
MNNQGSVCIVVVNYNGFEISRDCIESLLKLDYPSYCIVFVDNGSSDKSGDEINDIYKDRIVYLPLPKNLGVTGGNNAGIDYASQHGYEYVLFLNNDTVVDKTFLAKLIETSNKYNALVVPKIICFFDQSRLDHFIGTGIDWWTSQPLDYKPYPLDRPEFNIRSEIKVASTCCLLVPIPVFSAIGKMDEEYFMYQDDSDFTLRATRAGYRMFYEPEAKIFHKCNTTTSNKQPSYFEYYLQNRNLFYFYNKLCDKPVIKYLFFAKMLTRLFISYLLALVKRNHDRRRIITVILTDIATRTMGPVPNLGKSN